MSSSPQSGNKPGNILIIKLGSLGDIVMAEGAIHDIRLHHTDAKISVMTTLPYQKMFSRCPWVDDVIIDPREPRYRLDKMITLRNRLRKYNYDFVYDLQRAGRTSFYYTWVWGRSVPWVGKAKGCRYYTERIPGAAAMDTLALSLRNAGVQTAYALQSNVDWMADEVDGILSSYNLKNQKYVVLIPGCSAGHLQKRWPHYAELADHLIALGLRAITAPGPDEVELCQSIPGDMLLYQDKFLDYFKLAGVLQQAAYIIGNDTGPTHIGAHLKKRGLVLFSDHVPPTQTGIQHTLFNWLEAAPLEDLSVETVMNTVKADLDL